MSSKRTVKLQHLINKALLAIQDAEVEIRKIDPTTFPQWKNMTEIKQLRVFDDRFAAHNKLEAAKDNLHWALGYVEQL